MCKTTLPAYNSAKIIKIDHDFPELSSQMFCHLFMVHSVCLSITVIGLEPAIEIKLKLKLTAVDSFIKVRCLQAKIYK